MKTFCLLLLIITLQTIQSAPLDGGDELPSSTSSPLTTERTTSSEPTPTTEAVPPCDKTTDVYDLSQNGTDNYKLKVKGFTLLLAPSDALLGAAMMLGGIGDDTLVPPTRLNDQQAPAQRHIQPAHTKFSKLLHLLKKFNN